MPESLKNFASDYADWLTSRLSQQVRNGVFEVSTPILDPLNDGLRVYIETGSSDIIVHDGGITIETLALQGVDVHSSAKREALLFDILRSAGLTLDRDRITTKANPGNLPQRMHFLLTALNRISDLSLTARQSGTTDFLERVCGFLDEHGVLYSTYLSIPGKTVEHPVDIVIPLPKRRERLIRLIGTPNINTAKIVSFSWIEIAEVRPESERVILLNDESSIDESDAKSISQQTESILRGYSTGIFRWSQRREPNFEAFWKAA